MPPKKNNRRASGKQASSATQEKELLKEQGERHDSVAEVATKEEQVSAQPATEQDKQETAQSDVEAASSSKSDAEAQSSTENSQEEALPDAAQAAKSQGDAAKDEAQADAADAKAGYWGGIIINGKAVISGPAGSVSEGATEIDNNVMYGGDDNSDNSGVLTYVRILYSGARPSADIEHNGLTLNGVGNGTRIENIYIAEGADDAIEFFGGSVNVTNLLAVNCDDDCFDFTQGYCGTLSNCYGRWEAGFTSTEEDPRGVEADGNLDGNGHDHTPQANFTIKNMTIENLSTTQAMQDAIKVRRLAKANIENALVKGSGLIEQLVDLTDSKDNADAGTVVNVTSEATNVEEQTNSGNPAGSTVNIAAGNAGCANDIFGWTGYIF